MSRQSSQTEDDLREVEEIFIFGGFLADLFEEIYEDFYSDIGERRLISDAIKLRTLFALQAGNNHPVMTKIRDEFGFEFSVNMGGHTQEMVSMIWKKHYDLVDRPDRIIIAPKTPIYWAELWKIRLHKIFGDNPERILLQMLCGIQLLQWCMQAKKSITTDLGPDFRKKIPCSIVSVPEYLGIWKTEKIQDV